MKLIAITGGIGAGKSTVSRGLAARGAYVIDADVTARVVLDPATPTGRRVLADIAQALGPHVLQADGSLNRARVAELIFHDEAVRQQYNGIVHPAILSATAAAIDACRESHALVVHEIPLLTADSPALPWRYDLIVTVEADAGERRRRLQRHRGLSAEDAAARVAVQGDEERRIAIADIIVRTDGTLTETDRRVAELWRRLSE
ncbi:dephospho-CoA kinase [Microbacterium sp.]|uniref:dephospho-CoA kinase n=1 Tax=Microbacterium sp. TaxID=51671 RepID=UPI0028A64B16|nr:dephospho-CoA kinase [Microbacterium sp.]